MKTILTLIVLVSYTCSYSQAAEYNDIGSLAVLVQTKMGSGSGFYLADTSKNYICFVTASHVVTWLTKVRVRKVRCL
jgi:hypothetical protein